MLQTVAHEQGKYLRPQLLTYRDTYNKMTSFYSGHLMEACHERMSCGQWL